MVSGFKAALAATLQFHLLQRVCYDAQDKSGLSRRIRSSPTLYRRHRTCRKTLSDPKQVNRSLKEAHLNQMCQKRPANQSLPLRPEASVASPSLVRQRVGRHQQPASMQAVCTQRRAVGISWRAAVLAAPRGLQCSGKDDQSPLSPACHLRLGRSCRESKPTREHLMHTKL